MTEEYEIHVHRRWLYLRDDEPRLHATYEIWIGQEYVRGYPTRREAEDKLSHLNGNLNKDRSARS